MVSTKYPLSRYLAIISSTCFVNIQGRYASREVATSAIGGDSANTCEMFLAKR